MFTTQTVTHYVLQWKKVCILLSILSLVFYIIFGVQFIDSYKGQMVTKCVRLEMINNIERRYSAYDVYSALSSFMWFQPILLMSAILTHFARENHRVFCVGGVIVSYFILIAFTIVNIYQAGINYCFDEVSSLRTLLNFSIGFTVAQSLLICLLLPEIPRSIFIVACQLPKRIFNFFVKKECVTVV